MKPLVQPHPRVQGLTADSRLARPGMVFGALRGCRPAYVRQALDNGAAALVGSAESFKTLDLAALRATGVRVRLTKTPELHWGRLCRNWYRPQPCRLIAVTGTNGKSSVCWFINQLLNGLGEPTASLGTLGVWRGLVKQQALPLTTPAIEVLYATLAGLARQGVRCVALEASSIGLDQDRLAGLRLDAAVFTNLSQDHLDYHKDMTAYLQAKLRLLALLKKKDGFLVLNQDSGAFFGASARASFRASSRTRWAAGIFQERARERGLECVPCVRQGPEADAPGAYHLAAASPDLASCYAYRAEPISGDGHAGGHVRAAGFRCHLRYRCPQEGSVRTLVFTVPFSVEFQVENLVAALVCLLRLGYEAEGLGAACSKLTAPPGRAEELWTPTGVRVVIDYAHTPAALRCILESYRPHSRQLLCVFGAGGDRDASKRAAMGRAADQLADRVFITDDNPRNEDPAAIRRELQAACPQAEDVPDRRQAIVRAIAEAGSGDSVIIAGKGHEQGQILGDKIYPFSDRQEVEAVLGARPR